MFTFGRERERQCAVGYVRDASQHDMILGVVDAVHDFLEEKKTEAELSPILKCAFQQGGSGVWEQSGKWIRKLSHEYPVFLTLWSELAEYSDWKVRFRVACFLDEIPKELALELGARLTTDKSKKVREMALGRLEENNEECV